MHFPLFSVISVILCLVVSLNLGILPKKIISPLKIIRYSFWLIKEIIFSSIAVTKIIWSSQINIKPRIVEIDSYFKSPGLASIYANSITLTPGTISIDTYDNKILVHALMPSNIRELAAGDMQKTISKFLQ